MSSTPTKIKRQSKIITIELSVEDQDFIDRIAKEYGLKKKTDCLRLALREAVKRVESLQAA